MSVLSLLPEDKKKDSRKESLESVYSSNSRLNLLTKRKRLNPLTDMSASSKSGDKYVTQRVLSAKAHRVKQLQNQLADAHYHLQEISNENRVLRALQKKQEIALQRYENSNAELPSVLNSHNEEMRIQQTKYKQQKQQLKEVTQKLKERDMQLQQLRDEHQHLLELSKDRNLHEREKLQAQVSDLSIKVQQQNETISMLQRRLALEAKNFRYHLQSEINKHKDTRHDLDLAITNADKLSSIIEMKEKVINTSAFRILKSPPKPSATARSNQNQRTNRNTDNTANSYSQNAKQNNERAASADHLSRLCEDSRNLTSALSHEEDTSTSVEPVSRSRYVKRTNSVSTKSTPNTTRKNSKDSDDLVELAKTVQEGMADLTLFDEDDLRKSTSPEEYQQRIEAMKHDLLKKIRNEEQPRKTSALRRRSIDEPIEERITEEPDIIERPKSRGRRNSSVSFTDEVHIEDTTTTVAINDYRNGQGDELIQVKSKLDSILEKKVAGKPIDKYCNDLIQDIEKSNKVIEKHVKQFNHTKFEGDKLVQQLQTVDKLSEYMSTNGEIPEATLQELNNNFRMLTEPSAVEAPVARKRSIAGRRGSSRTESRSNLLGDSNLSNQDLLNDLLGRN